MKHIEDKVIRKNIINWSQNPNIKTLNRNKKSKSRFTVYEKATMLNKTLIWYKKSNKADTESQQSYK